MEAVRTLTRLADAGVSPSLQSTLHTLVEQDDTGGRHNWGHVIPAVAAALDAQEPASIQPFAAAWGLLNAALRRLDHVQDGDASDTPLLASLPVGAQYNVLLTYYLLATTLLDDLDNGSIPPSRQLRLRRLWADCLLRVADGQQADLESPHTVDAGLNDLDRYQRLVQAKTGALFALAFGGTATLLSDDPRLIATLFDVGEVFGMLVQYGDDVVDAALQVNPALTLPRAYHVGQTVQQAVAILPDARTFRHFVYTEYLAQVQHALTDLPVPTQTTICHLFTSTFEHRQHNGAT
jgi:hypothetical protein